MDGGLLSLKWNNHRSTFFYVLSNVRKKECYTDVTLACEGKFYPVHKLILSTCSEYFEQMFEQTQCKHPVIVLKDIRSEELESLLSYMYVGEVNVVQEKLSGLIKAAECLRIKGLAVPDEEPCTKSSSGSSREKRTSDNSISSEPKRRRQDDSGNFRQNVSSNSRGDDRRKSFDHQSSSSSNKYRNSSSNNITNNLRDGSRERGESDKNTSRERLLSQSSGTSNSNAQQTSDVKAEEPLESSEAEGPDEVTIDEPNEAVKQEPADLDAVYLSDSNSASESKDILMDNFGDGDGQQHFMDELLGQNSGSDQGHMGVGDFVEGGEGSSSAPSSQQQHMVVESQESSAHSNNTANVKREELDTSLSTPSSIRHQHHNQRRRWSFSSLSVEEGQPSLCFSATSHHTSIRTERTPSSLSAASHLHQLWASSSSSSGAGPQESALSSLSERLSQLLPQAVAADPHTSATSSSEGIINLNRLFGVAPTSTPSPRVPPGIPCGDGGGDAVPFDQLPLVPSSMYHCPVCGMAFANKARFRHHYYIHSGEKPRACPYCPYRARQNSALKVHILAKHKFLQHPHPT